MSPVPAQEAFLAILDRLVEHALFAFRFVRNEHDREDYVQELLCVAWKWTVRMVENAKDPREFPTAVAGFASRHVRSGRRFVVGKLGRKDALSRHAQAAGCFTVRSLPASAAGQDTLYARVGGQREHDILEQYLHDNAGTPVPDQVAFRIDFSAWRHSYDARRRAVLDEMMLGERTLDLAERFEVSPARINQLRREFEAGWRAFCGG